MDKNLPLGVGGSGMAGALYTVAKLARTSKDAKNERQIKRAQMVSEISEKYVERRN